MNIKSFFWLFILIQTVHAESKNYEPEAEFMDVSLEELADVNITSITKMAMPLNKSPVTAYVISQDEISRKGYRFLTDILKNTPEFYVTNLAQTEKAVNEIYIRGIFANNKITVLVDGNKIKAPTGEPSTFYNALPLIGVKQVEISLGSSSSVYGADAMLATINLVTNTGSHLDTVKIKATGGTADTAEVQVNAEKQINDDINVSLTGSFHHSVQENLRKNYPEIYGNAVVDLDLTEQNSNLYFKANYQKLVFSYFRTQTKNNNALSFTPKFYSGVPIWEPTNQTANVSYKSDLNPFWQAKSSLSYESTELSKASSYRTGLAPNQDMTWFGEALRFSETLAYLKGDINWLSGIEVSAMNSLPRNQYDVPTLPKYHLRYQNYAVYTQLNYDVTETFALNGSLRMDADSRYSPVFNPRFGFSWQAMTELRFFGSIGTSYLAPAPSSMYETWNMPSDPAYGRPNLNLRPEKTMTTELGFNVEPFKGNSFKMSGFFTDGKDLIRLTNIGNLGFWDNIATSQTYGFQIVERQTFTRDLSADVSYTLTQGQQDAEKLNSMVNITNSPEHMIKSNLLYAWDKFTFRFTGRWFDDIGTHESNKIYQGDQMHGTAIFDSNIHYVQPIQSAEFSVDLGVNNLLDTKYYVVPLYDNFGGSLSAQPQETRRVYLTVGLTY
ncbi:MAG: TonB-dependent receptor [Methylococcales bacterium]|nr:TonB-dependent receptor [Methylococcales bacterium]